MDKIIQTLLLTIAASFLFTFSSCKKVGREVLEETTEEFGEESGENLLKYSPKKAIRELSEEAIEKFIEKVSWLNDNKLDVIDAFMEENYECIEFASEEFDTEITEYDFREAMFVNNIYIFINGRDSEFSFDLDTEPDYLCGHLANMIVSGKYEIECDGING